MSYYTEPPDYDFGNDPIVAGYDPITGAPIVAVQDTSTAGPIQTFFAKIGRYPGNNKQWWVAKAPADDDTKGIKAGDFLPELLEQFYDGNNRAPKGHFILNQFHKDRSLISGVTNIPVEDVGERPNSVAFFSGRAWYACQSTVYYSQILDNSDAFKAGLCYQDADPTAEGISDLIATDGGVVPIPEANHIEFLCPIANGVMVFAQNGVWFISGGDAAFSATNIAVTKVSPLGTKSPQTVVETDNTIFWWSEVGIQAIQQASGQFGPIANKFGNTNIAEQTIQTFYNEIPEQSKHMAKGCLDSRNNTIYWLYSSDEAATYEYDSVLIYDITLQAFYPWKISELVGGPRINGLFLDTGYLDSGTVVNVTDNALVQVTTNAAQPVTQALSSAIAKPSALFYLTQVPGEGLTVAAPVNLDYMDWQMFDGVGAKFDSYILTGFELNNDAMRNKQIVYLFAHLRRTEDNLGNFPSSCKLTARWDWADDRNTRKWSSEVEVYRSRTLQLTDVVTSKNKVRGNGKSVQFRFGTNERGKGFDLLGWSVGYTGNTVA